MRVGNRKINMERIIVTTKPGHLRLLVLIPVLLAAGIAAAQSQDYTFHWAPSPDSDDQGQQLSPAVEYEVWLQRDLGAEEMVATVVGDTIYTLAAEPGVVHRLCVRGVDSSGRTSIMSPWSDPVYFEADERTGLVPPEPILEGNFPNPFNPETRIVYGVPDNVGTGVAVVLEIYNLKGERVTRLDVDRSPGWHEVVWDGRDASGQSAPTGIYLTRYRCGTAVQTNKMTMLK